MASFSLHTLTVSRTSTTALWVLAVLSCSALLAQPEPQVQPQATSEIQRDPNGPSADGLYWFEVEVVIFSAQYGTAQFSEIAVPSNNNLNYLPQLRALQNPLDVYRFDFLPAALTPAAFTQEASLTSTLPVIPSGISSVASEVVPLRINEGPLFSPAQPDAFKLLDSERDPYIKLALRFSRFTAVLNKLKSSNEHTVLWHQLWRQAITARAQTAAVQVKGGAAFGNHNELEGSLRLSGQGNAVTFDANIWLNSFSRDKPKDADAWQLPTQPQLDITRPSTAAIPTVSSALPISPLNADGVVLAPAESWFATKIWQLNQTRELKPNLLFYLDHPALGILIEIRPYLVPEVVLPVSSAAATAPIFE